MLSLRPARALAPRAAGLSKDAADDVGEGVDALLSLATAAHATSSCAKQERVEEEQEQEEQEQEEEQEEQEEGGFGEEARAPQRGGARPLALALALLALLALLLERNCSRVLWQRCCRAASAPAPWRRVLPSAKCRA